MRKDRCKLHQTVSDRGRETCEHRDIGMIADELETELDDRIHGLLGLLGVCLLHLHKRNYRTNRSMR